MVGKPPFRDLIQHILLLAYPLWRQNLKRQALSFAALQRLAQPIALRPFQAESVKIDACLFTDFHDSKAGIKVERQTIGTNLIEGGASTVLVRKFDEAPDQFRPFLATPYRVK